MVRFLTIVAAVLVALLAPTSAQQGQRGAPQAPPTARARAPFDMTGYWVSLIVDEWRFRVSPQRGDIAYLPINQRARDAANQWDPARDEAQGQACRAYGAIGVMQRPGRLHVTWQDDNTLKIEADAGTQTRVLHFGPPPTPAARGEASWQGYATADWQVLGAGRRGAPAPARAGAGTLRAVTTNMLPGYLRKNGVPYGANAVLTEYFNVLVGGEGEPYLSLTAMVDDSEYLAQPFVRTYTFKKQTDASGWDPTPCYAR